MQITPSQNHEAAIVSHATITTRFPNLSENAGAQDYITAEPRYYRGTCLAQETLRDHSAKNTSLGLYRNNQTPQRAMD